MSILPITSIPLDIRKELNDYNAPLCISERIFNEMKSQDSQDLQKSLGYSNGPGMEFHMALFHQEKPNRYNIKRIYCIYESHQQQAFEDNLTSTEIEASTFKPN